MNTNKNRLATVLRRKPTPGELILFSLILSIFAWHIYLASVNTFIGYADSAEVANIGRCLAKGNGYSTPTLWHFFEPSTKRIRPEDYYRPLAPVLTGISILFFGDTPLAAKLPNILLHIIFSLLVWGAGVDLFGRRIGLFGAVLFLMCRDVDLYATLPRTDFGLIFWLFAAVYLLASYPVAEHSPIKIAGLAGLFTGLAYLQRQLGVFLFPVAILFFVIRFFEDSKKNGVRGSFFLSLKSAAVFLAIFFVSISPYLVRNQNQFENPFHTVGNNFSLLSVKVFYDMKENPNERDPEHQYQTFGYYYNTDLTRQIYNKFGISGIVEKSVSEIFNVLTDFKRGNVILFLFIFLSFLSPLIAERPGQLFAFGFFALLVVHIAAIPVLLRSVQRYFVFILPFVSILSAATLNGMYEKFCESDNGSLYRWYYYIIVVAVVCAAMFIPFLSYTVKATRNAHKTHPYLHKAMWVAERTPPMARIMTLQPWEVAYHSRRSTVMIPYAPLEDIEQVIVDCNIDFVCIDRRRKPVADNVRPVLAEYVRSSVLKEFSRSKDYILFSVVKLPDRSPFSHAATAVSKTFQGLGHTPTPVRLSLTLLTRTTYV